jgi:hypothetical protein
MSLPCSSFVTKDYANATYLSISDAKNIYLSKSSASSMYLTTSKASMLYLSKILASSTYLTISDAVSLYLSKVDAESLYLKINQASQLYVDLSSTQTITGTKSFNDVYFNSIVYDSDNSSGLYGQVLSTTESGVKWIDVSSASTGSYVNYPVAQGSQTMLDTDISGILTTTSIEIGNTINTDVSYITINPTSITSNNYDGITQSIVTVGSTTINSTTYNGISIKDISSSNIYTIINSDSFLYYTPNDQLIVANTKYMMFAGNLLQTEGLITITGDEIITGSKTFNNTITLSSIINCVDSSNTVYLFPTQQSIIQIGSSTYNTSQYDGLRVPKYIDSVDLTTGIFLGYNHTGGYLRSNLAMVFDAESTANAIYVNYLHPTTNTTGTLSIGSALTSGDITIGNSSMSGNITLNAPNGYVGISGAIKLTYTKPLTSTDELGYYYYSTTSRSSNVSTANTTSYIFSPQSSDSTPPTILPVGIYRIDINGSINANNLYVDTLSYQFGYCSSTSLPMTSSNTTRILLTSVTNDTSYTSGTGLQTRSVFAGGVFTSNGSSYYTGWGSVTLGISLISGSCDVEMITVYITRIA